MDIFTKIRKAPVMRLLIAGIIVLTTAGCRLFPQQNEPELVEYGQITYGAQQTAGYLPLWGSVLFGNASCLVSIDPVIGSATLLL